MNRNEFLERVGERKLLFFDTETTGLYAMEKYSPDKIDERDIYGNTIATIEKNNYVWDEMIEIGYILVDPKDMHVIEQNEYLIQADKPISETIHAITGITNEDIESKGISKQELYQIMKPILDENPILIAYNTKFDITFIYKWLLEVDEKKYKYFNFDCLDVMTIYANYFPYSKEKEISVNHAGDIVEKCYGHRLVGAIRTLCNRELKQTHRALDDIEETIVVFNELKKICNIYDFINLLGYHPSRKQFRYFYSLKPYHCVAVPLLYTGKDFCKDLRENNIPKEYNGLLIPKWVFEQDFKGKLKTNKFRLN